MRLKKEEVKFAKFDIGCNAPNLTNLIVFTEGEPPSILVFGFPVVVFLGGLPC